MYDDEGVEKIMEVKDWIKIDDMITHHLDNPQSF